MGVHLLKGSNLLTLLWGDVTDCGHWAVVLPIECSLRRILLRLCIDLCLRGKVEYHSMSLWRPSSKPILPLGKYAAQAMRVFILLLLLWHFALVFHTHISRHKHTLIVGLRSHDDQN